MPTLFLRNIEQVALFKMELAGQISDGHWENAGPQDHWQVWCRCDVRVAPEGTKPGRNFYARRDKYGLTSSQLLSVVGGRMLTQVRVTQALGLEAAMELENRFSCLDDYAVEPITVPTGDEEYWVKERAMLKKYDLGVVNTHIMHGNYGKRELLRDLREIAEAMRTFVDTKDLPTKPQKTEPERFYGHAGLARAVGNLTGLVTEISNDHSSKSHAWYTLKTKTGMVVGNFETREREDQTWVVTGKGLPFPDDAFWEKIRGLGV